MTIFLLTAGTGIDSPELAVKLTRSKETSPRTAEPILNRGPLTFASVPALRWTSQNFIFYFIRVILADESAIVRVSFAALVEGVDSVIWFAVGVGRAEEIEGRAAVAV